MSAVRRSVRDRKSKQKYNVDPFENLNIESEFSNDEQPPEVNTGSEDEYASNLDTDIEEPDNDKASIDENSDINSSADGQHETDEAQDGDSIVEITPNPRAKSTLSSAKKKTSRPTSEESATHHSRGTGDILWRTGKRDKLTYGFGPTMEDARPVLKARSKWFYRVTLPSCVQDNDGTGGMAHNFYFSREIREQMAQQSWEWYFTGRGGDRFKTYQHMTQIAIIDSERYMPIGESKEHSLLLGPYLNQTLYTVKTGDVLGASQAWDITSEDQEANTDKTSLNPLKRGSWIINVGGKVQSLEWLPNQPGSTQYLSIVVYQKENQSGKGRPFRNMKAPAFTPTQSSSASIQIWAFEMSGDSMPHSILTTCHSPRLVLVICTDWGFIRQIKWCPAPMNGDSLPPHGESKYLGLLAGIWSDGKARVLDVSIPESSSQSTCYMHVESAAFEACAPNTLLTCISWVSSTSVAVGCANGMVAIWRVSECLGTPNPRPWFFESLHESYILAIASGYPSRPFIITTSGMDGFIRLTDVRSPHIDACYAARSRVGTRTLAWYETCQAFLSADENYTLTANLVRRFFMSISTSRVDSHILAVSVSPVHSSVLIACADGRVIAVNPLRRILDSKAEAFTQTWFAHEWRRPSEEICEFKETNAIDQAQLDHMIEPITSKNVGNQSAVLTASHINNDINTTGAGSVNVLNKPLSRITESYKLESSNLGTGMQGGSNVIEGSIFSTIHELKTAATAVAWNPNIQCGGLAAAGVAAGLVRIENLALEN